MSGQDSWPSMMSTLPAGGAAVADEFSRGSGQRVRLTRVALAACRLASSFALHTHFRSRLSGRGGEASGSRCQRRSPSSPGRSRPRPRRHRAGTTCRSRAPCPGRRRRPPWLTGRISPIRIASSKDFEEGHIALLASVDVGAGLARQGGVLVRMMVTSLLQPGHQQMFFHARLESFQWVGDRLTWARTDSRASIRSPGPEQQLLLAGCGDRGRPWSGHRPRLCLGWTCLRSPWHR